MLLSAVGIIALTGITLTTLKHRHDDSYVEVDGEENDNATEVRFNPKFYMHVKNHSTVKRSSGDDVQYSIADKDMSMIDEAKREKVKQVQNWFTV